MSSPGHRKDTQPAPCGPAAPGRPAANVYAATCPTRMVLDRIADKWAALVIGLLARGPMRFNQIRHTVDGLSQKMLSQTLKGLERDGLVTRSAFATVPVTVEYALTPLGLTLARIVDGLRVWSETHFEDVLDAQSRYDLRVGAGAAHKAKK